MKKGKLYQVSIDEIEYQPHFIMVYASEDAKDGKSTLFRTVC